MAKPTRRQFLTALGITAGAMAARPAAAAAQQGDDDAGSPPGEGEVALSTTVNGEQRDLHVRPVEGAAETLRERLGLTGTKISCGHGACGACTVLVDGTPVASCLLPATSLEGRSVTTVEGLGPELHPVQRAFLAEDALQCGFCTPGFVVEAVAFHDAWRAEHGTGEPDREAIADALAGHLCRCGAYEGIYRAVQAACRGEHDDSDLVAPRRDARPKVTGQARYTVDVQLPGQLEGRILRAPHANARVTRLDPGPAERLPGVHAVVDMLPDSRRVRYAGQEVAAVAAVDAHTAEEALRAIVVEYESSTPVTGLEQAMADGAPLVYGDDARAARGDAPSAAEDFALNGPWSGNVRGPMRWQNMFQRPGQARRRVEEHREQGTGTLVERRYRTHVQCHTALEPHACVAHFDGGELRVHQSTQANFAIAEDIAARWGLEPEAVHVRCPFVGGAFGAKQGLQPETVAAVDLARTTGAPVRVALTRPEEMAVGGNRPGVRVDLALAADEAGDLSALTSTAWANSGVAIGSSVSALLRLIYPHKAKETDDYDVVTHAPPGKPFRGPGGPAAAWAVEQAVDEMALRRGEDPLALRRRWDPNPGRRRLYDRVEALDWWAQRGEAGAATGRFRRGVGVAASTWFYFVQTHAQVQVGSRKDGRFVATCAVSDMGNGSRSAIAHAVAQRLGVPLSAVEVEVGDSHFVRGPTASGSRTTTSVVPAAEAACDQLAEALAEVAEDAMGLSDPRPAPGGLDHAGGHVPWAEVLARAPALSFVGRRRRDEGGYFLPFRMDGNTLGKGSPGAVTVTEVEVDTRLGRVRPLRVWLGITAGRIVAPALALSQAEGGVIQGLSYALYEERVLDPGRGVILTAGLEDYRIAGLGDIPRIDVHFDEQGFEHVRGGAVGLSELSTVGVAASVGNAVHHATGWRPTALPLRPDVVRGGLS